MDDGIVVNEDKGDDGGKGDDGAIHTTKIIGHRECLKELVPKTVAPAKRVSSLYPPLRLVFNGQDVSVDPNGAGLEECIRFIATSKSTTEDICSIQTSTLTCEDGFLEYPREIYGSEEVLYDISEGAVVSSKVQRGVVIIYGTERPEPKPPDSYSSSYNQVAKVEETVGQEQEVGSSVNTAAYSDKLVVRVVIVPVERKLINIHQLQYSINVAHVAEIREAVDR